MLHLVENFCDVHYISSRYIFAIIVHRIVKLDWSRVIIQFVKGDVTQERMLQ